MPKKNYINYRFILLLITLLITQSYGLLAQKTTVNPNGYNTFYYGDGSVASEGFMKDGKPDGFWKTYYPTGIKKSEGKRTNFQLDSVWCFFNENGDTIEKISYRIGVKNGYHFLYEVVDSIGKVFLKSKELYVDGIKQGKSFYYSNGKLLEEVTYLDNAKNGTAIRYSDDGRIIALTRYKRGYIADKEIINRYNRQGQKHGTWKTFHDNGKLQTQANYKNGKLEGYYKQYDEYGKQIVNQLYADGQKVVPKKQDDQNKVEIKNEYFADGQLKKSGGFNEKNTPVGVHREYGKDGQVKAAITYTTDGRLKAKGIVKKNGNRQGSWENFYPDGNPSSKGNYEKGRRHGKWQFLFENGKLEQEGSYYYGKRDGKWIWYFANGNVRRIEHYQQGKLNGSFVEFDEDGTELIKGEYLNNEKAGKWKYNIGDLIEEGEYIYNVKNGVWKAYFLSGKLKFEGEFNQGEARGKHLFYYENGLIRLSAEYSRGQPDGIWRWYDQMGLETLTIEYKKGEKIKIDGFEIDPQANRN